MRKIAGIAALLGWFLCFPECSLAQFTLSDVQVAEAGPLSVIEVSSTVLVRYVQHYPENSGDELRIQLELIGVTGDQVKWEFRRQIVSGQPKNAARLTEVVYEGDVDNGPYLTLFFRRPVGFQVQQGSDFRSIVVVVHPLQGLFEAEGKVVEMPPETSQLVLSLKVASGNLRVTSLLLKFELESLDLAKGLKPDDRIKFIIDGAKQKIVAIEASEEG